MIICKQSKTCEARGYCYHAKEHEETQAYKQIAPHVCNEHHLCEFTETDVICEECDENTVKRR